MVSGISTLWFHLDYFRYNANKFTTEGMAVIEMGIPTGFVAELESDITKLTEVQKTETDGQKVMMYFDEVSFCLC